MVNLQLVPYSFLICYLVTTHNFVYPIVKCYWVQVLKCLLCALSINELTGGPLGPGAPLSPCRWETAHVNPNSIAIAF